jgi:bacillithiol biosynthesis cysteine-adding enzyme BshC
MPTQTLSYKKTGYFSKLVCDYLSEDDALKSFYKQFPSLENFEAQFQEKQMHFSTEKRELLSRQIKNQYGQTPISRQTSENIDALKNSNTFTITTGHQLNLFTGPLFFLYKIFSVINLCEELSKKHPDQHFVPIYWMATEDHDFEEINFFHFQGKKFEWDREAAGAVGELSTAGLEKVKIQLEKEFGSSDNGKRLLNLFSDAYLGHKNLADATRFLANELFSDYGLVIVDGNDAKLKEGFIPYAEKELTENLSHSKITETTDRLLSFGYPEQVHPREINLFYLKENLRERIVKEEGRFLIMGTEISFSEEEIIEELQRHPERFSPNALLRPLYQEVILPNLCYIGGGGELAYWFQLKDYFQAVAVPFPIILLRNSALLASEKTLRKTEKLKTQVEDLFLPQHELMSKHTKQISEIEIDFSPQMEFLKEQFKALYELAEKTDKSFVGAVAAQEKKQLNGLRHLEKRLLKAQKRKFADELHRLKIIQDELFPNQSLQERYGNFSEFYLDYGNELLNVLKKELKPLDLKFTVVALQ